MREVFDLGVLFVHGIGSQRRGDTLQGFSDPLADTVNAWFGPGSAVPDRTELTSPAAPAPANGRYTIDRDGRRKRLLVAESTWADAFSPPGWWALALWLWWAVPFVVFRATDHRLGMIGTNQQIDETGLLRRPDLWVLNHAWRLVKNVFSLVIVLLWTVVLALLGIIAIVPRLRRAVLSAQNVLIQYIGDSYDLLVSSARGDAMVSRVEADLAWLESQHGGNVVIVAHSQGAELVRRVLARRPKGRPVMSLVTFGSGIAKLRAVERLRGRGRTAFGAYVLRTIAALLTVFGVVFPFQPWIDPAGWLDVVIALALLAASAGLISGARVVLKRIVNVEDIAGELRKVVDGRVTRWVDFYATSDPVPEGRLPVDKVECLKFGSSTRIANYRSPLFDHTSYFDNSESFRPGVLAELSTAAGWWPTGLALRTIGISGERRGRATLRLAIVRVLLAAAAVALIVLPLLLDRGRGRWDDAADSLHARLDSLPDWLPGPPDRDLALAVAVLVGAALLYWIYLVLFKRYAARRGAGLFERAWPCEPDVVIPRLGPFSRLSARIGDRVDRKYGWDAHPHRFPRVLPTLRGTLVLYGLRVRLRQFNLYDEAAYDPRLRRFRRLRPKRKRLRTPDGKETDERDLEMGAVGQYFGRNGPSYPAPARLPPAKKVADELLQREDFIAASSLNLLAAAWVQFEVHDWMQHVALPVSPPSKRMPPFEHTPESRPAAPRLTSAQTHWWDASQLYGAEDKFTKDLRTGNGRVKTGDDLLRTIEKWMGQGVAPVPNLWLGLAVFHVIFAREHNAICDRLEQSNHKLQGDALFDQARMINAAVMAKIHTVEWTPAVIAHPTTEKAIRATWFGELGEWMHKLLPWVHLGDVLSGIPGSRTHLDGVRYSLTEEFVAVYRMHPLIPEEVRLRHADGSALWIDGTDVLSFSELAASSATPEGPRRLLARLGDEAAIYTLATEHPGAISLRNYPRFLRELRPAGMPKGTIVDVAERDIARMREAAVPRYNDFRRMLRLEPCTTFSEIAGGDEGLAAAMRELYSHVDDVDLMVGLFGERKPRGFAFSDTAFRIFLLMAARRLRSDPFFTSDFNNRVYTRAGMKWIRQRSLTVILAEYFPSLRGTLKDVKNPFAPWP